MKKVILILSAALFAFSSFKKQPIVLNKYEFKIVQYQPNGTILNENKRTIETAERKTDLLFYTKHFDCPYNIPPKFTDEKFKSATDTVRGNHDAAKKSGKNPYWTYTYNRASKLIHYTFSGCIVCNNMPYSMDVLYDKQGRVTDLQNASFTKTDFKIHYAADGSIKQIDKLTLGKPDSQIIRVN